MFTNDFLHEFTSLVDAGQPQQTQKKNSHEFHAPPLSNVVQIPHTAGPRAAGCPQICDSDHHKSLF